jgi:cell wall-associated NlpC family hydrolase
MDCWALVRDHLAPEQRATLADVSAADAPRMESLARAEVAAGRWRAVWPPAPGDVVLMGSAGEAKHAGIAVEGGIRHWTARHGVVVQPLRALRAYRQIRAYRWAG